MDSSYNYWVLRFRESGGYVGKRTDIEPFSEVGPSKRIRYLSLESAKKGVSYLEGFGLFKIQIVRVRVKRVKAPERKKTVVKAPEVKFERAHNVYDEPKSHGNRKCPVCGPMQDCDHSVSSFCHFCGPMNYCMCNEDNEPRWAR